MASRSVKITAIGDGAITRHRAPHVCHYKPTLTAQPNKSALSSFCKSGPWKIRRLFANSTLAWYSASRMVLQAGANARTPSHLSPIKDPDRCPHCNSKRLIKKGTRKKKHEDVPLFLCRSCGRKFTVGPRTIRNKTYPLPEILEALSLYDRGNTLEATAEKISSRYGHRVAPSTISRWLSEHPSLTTYRRLRERGQRLFTPTQLIRTHKLYHRQVYEFAYHREARISQRRHARRQARSRHYFDLALFGTCRLSRINSYNGPHDLFQREDGSRGSQLAADFLALDKLIVVKKQNAATETAALIVPAVVYAKEACAERIRSIRSR
jgi:transposase-like protein